MLRLFGCLGHMVDNTSPWQNGVVANVRPGLASTISYRVARFRCCCRVWSGFVGLRDVAAKTNPQRNRRTSGPAFALEVHTMTRSIRLSAIFWISLLVLYAGAFLYILRGTDIPSRPIESLPAVFWISVVAFALLPLAIVFFPGKTGATGKPPTGTYIVPLLSGLLLIFIAFSTSLEKPSLTGRTVFFAATGCGMVLSALAMRGLTRTRSEADS
jgi:hypothetical protein